jgi:N6-L-threonylcarbamoyladenine synthase
MICLGIESTAHTFGIAIVDEKCDIFSNERDTFTTKEGGMIPRELAQHHFDCAPSVLKNAIKKAGILISDVNVIAFSQGPGIGPALEVGAVMARALALKYKKPLLGVNHCIGHIEIGKQLTGATDPIIVFTSGANCQIIGFENGKYRVYGETLDTGIGNVLDSFGRKIGLGFPAGPTLDKWYFESKEYIELPYTVKGMDLAFSGLLTAAEKKVKDGNEKDVARSLLHNAFAMVTEVAERALAHTGKKEIVLTGGVAASKALREMIGKMCEQRHAKLFVPPFSTCTDSGLLPAWQGLIEFKAGRKQEIKDTLIDAKQRVDDVQIFY